MFVKPVLDLSLCLSLSLRTLSSSLSVQARRLTVARTGRARNLNGLYVHAPLAPASRGHHNLM